MKIGVITYWYGNNNYGMMLQCWALQQYLKRQGHDPYIIRYKPKGSLFRILAKKIIRRISSLISKRTRTQYKSECEIQKYNEMRDCERHFEEFRNDNLIMSKMLYTHIEELQRNPPVADCYIAGSDSIWSNVLKVKDSWGFYLAFGNNDIKRIAYAPSFGSLVVDSKQLKHLRKALANFDYISCREARAVSICKDLGYEVEKAEDPTLLLEKEDYYPICESIDYHDYIYIYSVNMSCSDDIYWDDVQRFYKDKNIIVTPSTGYIPSKEIFGDAPIYVYATPGTWLSLILNSSMFITSSFHGVVFALIFNKKFAYLPLKGKHAAGNNRITDLLKALDLEYLIVYEPSDYSRINSSDIDWTSVNRKRFELVKASKEFLEKSIHL